MSRLSGSILFCIFAVFASTFLFSCGGDKEKKVESTYDAETVPSVTTYNDTIYISDSGRVRFKVLAQTILMFDKAKDPFTLFPDSAYLEEYDTLMNVVTTLRADSAWNYTRKKLWKLRGNVKIVNIEGKTFDSEELFWDEKEGKIYSDLYVEIKDPGEATIRAYGFESNQSMTEYTFRSATDVDIYLKEDQDSIQSDIDDVEN